MLNEDSVQQQPFIENSNINDFMLVKKVKQFERFLPDKKNSGLVKYALNNSVNSSLAKQ